MKLEDIPKVLDELIEEIFITETKDYIAIKLYRVDTFAGEPVNFYIYPQEDGLQYILASETSFFMRFWLPYDHGDFVYELRSDGVKGRIKANRRNDKKKQRRTE